MTRQFHTGLLASLFVVAAPVASAQIAGSRPVEEHLPVTEQVRQMRMMHVSPHKLILDAQTSTAQIEFSNQGDQPVTAEVQVLFANMDYPHDKVSDATLFTPHWEKVFARDTVVLNPKPTDRFAGRWLSGLPAQVTLAPKQKKSVAIRMAAPANIPDGVYWARIVTIVRPPEINRHPGKPKDERTIYSLPVKGQSPPMLRDSVELFYKKGQVKMGLRLGAGAVAAIDTVGYPGPDDVGSGNGRLWFNLPLELTGNSPFMGVLHVSYKNLGTGAEEALTPAPMILYRNAVTHWWGQADKFPNGKYEIIMKFDAPQEDIPPSQRIPVTPLTVRLPFEIHR